MADGATSALVIACAVRRGAVEQGTGGADAGLFALAVSVMTDTRRDLSRTPAAEANVSGSVVATS